MGKKVIKALNTKVVRVEEITKDRYEALQAKGFLVIITGRKHIVALTRV